MMYGILGVLALAMVVGIPVAGGAWELLQRRRRRREAGPLCSRCGYNLTGLSNDRCPECGLAFFARPSTLPNPPA